MRPSILRLFTPLLMRRSRYSETSLSLGDKRCPSLSFNPLLKSPYSSLQGCAQDPLLPDLVPLLFIAENRQSPDAHTHTAPWAKTSVSKLYPFAIFVRVSISSQDNSLGRTTLLTPISESFLNSSAE